MSSPDPVLALLCYRFQLFVCDIRTSVQNHVGSDVTGPESCDETLNQSLVGGVLPAVVLIQT